jgi:DNA-binding response OmpR family regulator
MKILIAEDDLTSRTMLVLMLRKNGHEVIESTNGAEAWQVLQQADAPQLVILDWMMPEMDGSEVLRLVRSVETDRPPYIIMLTARNEKPNIIAGLDAGANDYLAKPFDPGELLARVEVGQRVVETQLRRHRQRAHAQRLRVEASQRLVTLQDTLTARDDELRRAQADIAVLTAHLQGVREEERARISLDLHNTLGRHLLVLCKDLIEIDLHLRSNPTPEMPLVREKITALVALVTHLSDQSQTLCTNLLSGTTQAAQTRAHEAAGHL